MNSRLTYILCSLGGIFVGLSFLGGLWMLLALVGLLAFVFAYIYNSSRDSTDAPIPSVIQRSGDTSSFKMARITTKTALVTTLAPEHVQEEPLIGYKQEELWRKVDQELSQSLGHELTILLRLIPNIHTAAYFLLRSKENVFIPLKVVGTGASKINGQARIGAQSSSLLSRLLKVNETQILEGDLTSGKALQIYKEDVPVKSVFAIPITNQKKVRCGFLMLDSLQLNAFNNLSQDVLLFAAGIMQLLSTKIYAAAYNYIQQEQYAVLYEYQQKFFDSMSVKDVYRHIGEYIENYVPFDRMMLLARDLQDEDKGKVVVAKGEDSDFFKDMEFSLNDKGVLVYALNRSIPVERLLKNDKADYTIRFNSEERRNDSLHYLCATSSTSDIPIANFTIALEKKNPSAYSEHDKIRLRTIARTASFALERVVQFEKGKDLAMRDGLTGLMNHRTMHEKLNIEKMRAERQKINIGLLMMDIDKFKSINDTYGHPAGDEIIKGIARTIVTEVRSEIDIVARYGGEEFVVALIDTSEVGLKETAERIRLAIERASFDIKQKLPLKVTVSIGAYLKRPDGRYSMAESLKFADSALYKAKEGGRNQVVEYLETEPENSTISEEENR